MSVLHPSARELKSANQRKKIMDAAVGLFRQHGFEAVGVRDITEAAGVSTGTFYHYFSSKQDVFNAVHVQARPNFPLVFEELSQNPSSAAALKEFLAKNLTQQILRDGLEFTCHRMFVIRKHSSKDSAMYQGCLKLVEMAQQKGELNEQLPAQTILDHLLIVQRGVVYEWCVSNGEFDLKQRMEQSIDFGLRSFLK